MQTRWAGMSASWQINSTVTDDIKKKMNKNECLLSVLANRKPCWLLQYECLSLHALDVVFVIDFKKILMKLYLNSSTNKSCLWSCNRRSRRQCLAWPCWLCHVHCVPAVATAFTSGPKKPFCPASCCPGYGQSCS